MEQMTGFLLLVTLKSPLKVFISLIAVLCAFYSRDDKYDPDNIYFNVKDVSTGFEMPRLQSTLIDKDGAYQINKYYRYFVRTNRGITAICPNEKPINKPTKSLYLTYSGIMRVLFVSRNKHAERFQKWAIDILFVHQLGSKEQRIKVGTNLLGISVENFKVIFDSYAFEKDNDKNIFYDYEFYHHTRANNEP